MNRQKTSRSKILPSVVPLLLIVFLLVPILILSACRLRQPSAKPSPLAGAISRFDAKGVIQDQDRKLVPHADVFLYYARSPWGIGDQLIGRTQTNSRGAFRFKKSVAWGPFGAVQHASYPRYEIIARHPSRGMAFTLIFPKDSPDRLRLALRPAVPHTVRVFDDSGAPIQDATVFLHDAGWQDPAAAMLPKEERHLALAQDIGICSSKTDAQGQALLPAFPSGCQFRVEKNGYSSWVAVSADGLASGTLHAATRIQGKVTYPDGSPAAGVAVYGEYPSGYSLVTTDSDGRYVLSDVPAHRPRFWGEPPVDYSKPAKPWNASVWAEDPRPDSVFLCKAEGVVVNPSTPVTRDMAFFPGIMVGGKIVNAATGEPVPHIHLGIDPRSILSVRPYPTSAAADANGNFRVVLPPDKTIRFVWLRNRADGYRLDETWLNQRVDAFNEMMTGSRTDLVFPVRLQE